MTKAGYLTACALFAPIKDVEQRACQPRP
jgi:hypothetical protein